MNAQEILFSIRDIAVWIMGGAFLIFMICIFTGKKLGVKIMPIALWIMIITGAIAVLTHVIRLIMAG